MIEKSDRHYREIEQEHTEPIIVMEELAERLYNNGVPPKAIINIVLAQKHQLRAGSKDGNSWRLEIQKSINYQARAITGEWAK